MKKIKYLLICFFVLNFNLRSQIFTVSSGTDLVIKSGATFSVDNLTLVPSADYTLSNLSLARNATKTNAFTDPFAVSRFYKFSATTNAYSGTIQVNYSDGELNGLTESTLRVNVHNGTSWSDYASTTNETTNNYVLSNSLSAVALNEIALASSSAPLPVELKSFTARIQSNNVFLNWSTATESNNSGFDIERLTGKRWMKIGFVKGSGTSSIEHQYSYNDARVNMGKYEYRLKQIDLDGKFEFSRSIPLSVGLNKERIVLSSNYPNPFNSETVISYQVPKTGMVKLSIYDLTGREVASLVNEEKEEGFHEVRFNASNITSGIYFYNLHSNGQTEIKRMILMK